MRSVSTIAPLERQLGLPVISSNQAMLWEMLQASGYDRPLPGYGRLLAEPVQQSTATAS
jgi:maleate cis-trans isomerase